MMIYLKEKGGMNSSLQENKELVGDINDDLSVLSYVSDHVTDRSKVPENKLGPKNFAQKMKKSRAERKKKRKQRIEYKEQ